MALQISRFIQRSVQATYIYLHDMREPVKIAEWADKCRVSRDVMHTIYDVQKQTSLSKEDVERFSNTLDVMGRQYDEVTIDNVLHQGIVMLIPFCNALTDFITSNDDEHVEEALVILNYIRHAFFDINLNDQLYAIISAVLSRPVHLGVYTQLTKLYFNDMHLETDLRAAIDLFQHLLPENEPCFNMEGYLSSFTLDRDPVSLIQLQNQRLRSRFNVYRLLPQFAWLLVNRVSLKNEAVTSGQETDEWSQEVQFFDQLLRYSLDFDRELVGFHRQVVQTAPECGEDWREMESEYRLLQRLITEKMPRHPLYYCSHAAGVLAAHTDLDAELLVKAARSFTRDGPSFYGAILKQGNRLWSILYGLQETLQRHGAADAPRALQNDCDEARLNLQKFGELMRLELETYLDADASLCDFLPVLSFLLDADMLPSFETYQAAAQFCNKLLDFMYNGTEETCQMSAKLLSAVYEDFKLNHGGYETYLALGIKQNFIRVFASQQGSYRNAGNAIAVMSIVNSFRELGILESEDQGRIAWMFAVEQDYTNGAAEDQSFDQHEFIAFLSSYME